MSIGSPIGAPSTVLPSNEVVRGWKAACLSGWANLVRWLPKGKSTFFRWGWRALGSPAAFLGNFQGVQYIVRPQDAATSLTPFLFQAYEPVIAHTLRELLRDGGTFVDVGANIGLVSLLGAQCVGRKGRVVSYEPLSQNVRDMELIRQNAGCDTRNWLIVPSALSDRRGTCRIDWSGEAGWCRIDESGEIEIEARTFDEELDRLEIAHVDLVKIDVEGHETAVIRGMRQSLSRGRVGGVLMELHVPAVNDAEVTEILETFEQSGFSIFRVLEDSTSGPVKQEQVDASFRPRHRLHLLFTKN